MAIFKVQIELEANNLEDAEKQLIDSPMVTTFDEIEEVPEEEPEEPVDETDED